MKKSAWLLLLFIWTVTSAKAQQNIYYTINIGTFVDAKVEDFAALQPIGFLHASSLEENLSQIYLGGYKNLNAATADLAKVRTAGYTNAYIQENFLSEGQNVAVVQIATLPKNTNVNWSKYADAGNLYLLLENNMIKITVGTFADASQARPQVSAIRQKGFKDAFVKIVNSVYLHELGAFETGSVIKKPLIPFKFEDGTPVIETEEARPDDYNQSNYPETRPTPQNDSPNWTRKGTATKTMNLPAIRGDIKRRSALELQKVLKAEGSYTAGLDGYYGNGTKSAYQNFVDQNYDYKKYQLLAKATPAASRAEGDRLQRAINNLPSNPAGVEGYPNALAKAYQAYVLFTKLGPDNSVNNLMNTALKEAYLNTPPQMVPGFDYRATYAYNDLTQLILHLYYTHAAPGINYKVPCWLAERHPDEVARANANFMGQTLPMQDCNQFGEWEEISILAAIATDLTIKPVDPTIKAKAAAARSSILLTQQPLSAELNNELEQWNNRLWQGVSTWGNADPLHGKLVTTLKVAYFQAQVRLEDYFMDKGFRAAEAKGLSLATLRSLVGNELDRFVQ